MERFSDTAIGIINELHRDRLEYHEYEPLIDAAQKLAAYEDTELEPEEIEVMKRSHENLVSMYQRMEELAQADKEGRVVVLPPVKIGEYVHFLYEGKPAKMRVQGMGLDYSNRVILRFGGYPIACAYADEIGKTIFLTEKALKERAGE